MECELDGRLLKYEDGKLYVWREMWRKHKLKNPYWCEVKGSVDKRNGYRYVGINYKNYRFHRLVYFLHHQEWDIHNSSIDNSIDHIDRNPLNNNIENLRVVTNQQNAWNTNAKGYYFNKEKGKYQAQICVNCKHKYLGYFESENDARNAYLIAKEKYHIF
tara:strand:+ start:503 stop:982 length:480 start_codon:yes stop_codon:yes gene_type:complete